MITTINIYHNKNINISYKINRFVHQYFYVSSPELNFGKYFREDFSCRSCHNKIHSHQIQEVYGYRTILKAKVNMTKEEVLNFIVELSILLSEDGMFFGKQYHTPDYQLNDLFIVKS